MGPSTGALGPSGVASCTRRPFCLGAFLHDGVGLLREHPLIRISFVDDQGGPAPPEAVADLAASPAMAFVRSLDLSCGCETSPWSRARGSRANPDWARCLARASHIERLDELIFGDSEGPGESFLSKENSDSSALAASHLRTLRHLDLQAIHWNNPNLDSEAVRILAAASFVQSLRHLDLGDCPIGEEGIALITSHQAFSSLESLDLSYCSLGDRSVKAVLESARTLDRLATVRMDLEADLGRPWRLPRAWLGCVRWPLFPPPRRICRRAQSEAFWLMIAGRPPLALQSLTLDGCRITPTALEALACSGALANLLEWRCRNLRTAAEVDWRFLASGALKRLTVLDLGSSGSTANLDWLASWPGLAQLVELDLSGFPRLSRFLSPLRNSPYFGKSLQALSLVSCDLDENAILALARCPGLARLKSLNLNWQSLSARSVEALASSPWLQRLEKLHLAGHPLQRVEAQCLEAPNSLTHLLDVAISESERGPTREALRRRFGPRLRLLIP